MQIWKTHKLVCGKNPFEWPPLSQKEVEEAWASRNSNFTEDKSQTCMSDRLWRSEGPSWKNAGDCDYRYKVSIQN